jgi:hypothetical protein
MDPLSNSVNVHTSAGSSQNFTSGAVVSPLPVLPRSPYKGVRADELSGPDSLFEPTPCVRAPTTNWSMQSLRVPSADVVMPSLRVPSADVAMPSLRVPSADVAMPSLRVPSADVAMPSLRVPSADVPPMPPTAPKLVECCTSWKCVCPEGADNCQWYAENMAGKAIGALRARQADLLSQKTEVEAAIVADTTSLTESTQEPARSKLATIDCDLACCEEDIERVTRLRAKRLPLSILPSSRESPWSLEQFTWPKESVDLFEEVITWHGPNWGCYTPNSRHESEGIEHLGDKPGDWTFFYCKNGRVRYYFYRSLAGEVWKIGFFHGVFNSADPYTR